MSSNSPEALADYQRLRRIVIACLCAVIGCGLVFVASSHGEEWHEEIEGIGSMLILIGIGGRLWSTLYIGGRKASEVVEDGPYSIMRNPLYFFSGVAAVGAGAQAGSIILAAAFGVICFAAFTVVILREEKWLSANMGQSYRDYLARVPRLFPNPSLYHDKAEVTFQPRLLKRTLVDGLAFFISVPLFEAIEMGQQSGLIPVLAHVS